MKNCKKILLVLVVGIVFLPTLVFAEPSSKSNVSWSSSMNRRTGLYSSKSSLMQSLTVSIDGLYYYGDMEGTGFSLRSPSADNLGFGITANYIQGIAKQLNARYSVGGGFSQGSNARAVGAGSSLLREFSSGNGKIAAGVEWYPVPKAGFYLYAGVALQYNCVTYNTLGYTGVEHTFMPMIPVEIGYNFSIADHWLVGLHIGVSQGLVDVPHMNLDAWPIKDMFGNSPYNKWSDGYLQFGISIGYDWKPQCETCRLYKW